MALVGLALLAAAVEPAVAQDTVPVARPGEVETEPIRCWWRSEATAVRVGQRFTLVLTCGVIETGQVRVAPNLTELDPSTVELTPFEVIGGETYEDVVSPPWRYFQFEYHVRLLSEEHFGADVDLPALAVTYNIQSTEGGGIEGRDQTYLMPTLPIRVFSLVPENAADIRDASTDTFAEIEARDFRASGTMVVAGLLFGFALLLAALAVLRGMGHYRQRVPAVRTAPLWVVLGASVREAGRVKREVEQDGWTPDRVGRALTVLRIGGAIGLDRPVAQQVVDRYAVKRPGQLSVRTGILRPRRLLVSGAATPEVIERHLARPRGRGPGERVRAILLEIQEALAAFSRIRYARTDELEAAALDSALEDGTAALRRLRVARLWRLAPRFSADLGLGLGAGRERGLRDAS